MTSDATDSTGWRIGPGKRVPLPAVMAILNATPDSFYPGSRHPTLETALRAIQAGAQILDVGPESSRPGSEPVAPGEQITRAVPLIEAIRRADRNIAITIDTTSAAVAAAALDAGADAINDISAGVDDPAMFGLTAARGCGIVLMHRLVRPVIDQYSDRYDADGGGAGAPVYADVVREVREYLQIRAEAAIAAGVPREGIVLDPGLGFGKTVDQNVELVRRTREITSLGYRVLSGASRKSFVGRVSLGRDSTPDERLAGSLAFTVLHFLSGASIFRVHDIEDSLAAIRAAARVSGPPPTCRTGSLQGEGPF